MNSTLAQTICHTITWLNTNFTSTYGGLIVEHHCIVWRERIPSVQLISKRTSMLIILMCTYSAWTIAIRSRHQTVRFVWRVGSFVWGAINTSGQLLSTLSSGWGMWLVMIHTRIAILITSVITTISRRKCKVRSRSRSPILVVSNGRWLASRHRHNVLVLRIITLIIDCIISWWCKPCLVFFHLFTLLTIVVDLSIKLMIVVRVLGVQLIYIFPWLIWVRELLPEIWAFELK